MARLSKAHQTRKRLYDDFPFYAKTALKIRPKDPKPGQGIVPLVLNKAQEIFLEQAWKQWEETGKIRIIVLKGRQQGLSTLIEAMLYWYVSQRQGMRGMVVAHNGDSTDALYTMTQRYHDHCPKYIRPHTRYSSKKELVFDTLDASVAIGTAGSKGLGRGNTIQFLHASELAWWPGGQAEEVWGGLTRVMPPVDGSICIVESTAFGNSGVYYDLWQGATDGLNEYLPIFIPWPLQVEYSLKVPAGFERTFEEEEYVAAYRQNFGHNEWFEDITDGNLQFRRMNIGEIGLGKFQQEYPLTAEEAFQASGMQVFRQEKLNEMKSSRDHPIASKNLIGDRWEEGRNGKLAIYKPHDYGETYVIGSDVGAGISTSRKNADYSVAVVLDSNKEQVAQLRARVLPGDFAGWVNYLGVMYNDAEICMENANHGYHACQVLARDYLYPHFWTEEVFDKITEQFTTKLGFTTSVKSKPMIINKLRDSVAKGDIKINDLTTLDEMRSFIIHDNGTMSGDIGTHDDTVIALALANHIHQGKHTPITDYELFDPEEGQGSSEGPAVFADGDELEPEQSNDDLGAYG